MIRAGTRDKGQGTRDRGFTLVEISIVALIFVVLSAGLITTFLTGRTSYMAADAYVQVQQESRRAFDVMVRELREAGSVTVGDVGPNPNSGRRLNFRIALGYNINGIQPACPQNDVCWGSEDHYGTGYVHYAVIAADNIQKLIRYTDTNAAGNPPASCTVANSCRVLANYLPAAGDIFTYSTNPTKTVTVNLQIVYANPILPTGSMSSPALSSKVTLRN